MQTREVNVADGRLAELFTGVMPAVRRLDVESYDFADLLNRPRVAIVGSRKVTPYGNQVTMQLAGDLAKQGIVVVSGLAYGVDAVAHRAALEVGGLTIAVLPSALDDIYPRGHQQLAARIVEGGGALVSEYEPGTPAYRWNFIERNRIVSGISDVLLITEAAINSGTMHTARFAIEQGKEVLVVPGNITSRTSEGTNQLLKTGATPVTSAIDVLHVLGLKPTDGRQKVSAGSPEEQTILYLLDENITDGNELLEKTQLSADIFNHTLTMMEITGKVRALGNNHWANS